MTQCELAAALLVWNMTINHIINSPDDSEEILEIAYKYGQNISTKDNIDALSFMFNWDEFANIVEGLKK